MGGVLGQGLTYGPWFVSALETPCFTTGQLQSTVVASDSVTAGVAQLVEHQLPKLRVAGSNPVARSVMKPPGTPVPGGFSVRVGHGVLWGCGAGDAIC